MNKIKEFAKNLKILFRNMFPKISLKFRSKKIYYRTKNGNSCLDVCNTNYLAFIGSTRCAYCKHYAGAGKNIRGVYIICKDAEYAKGRKK